jgi:peptide/nickel transport system substrate-binding protein
MTKRIVVGALLLATVVAGCGGSGNGSTGTGSASGQGKAYATGGTFTLRINTDPAAMDPLKAADNTTILLNSFAYDTLINLDEKGKPVPQLATKWEVDAKTVTYTLRKGVTCADGTTLTAKQVAANFEFIKNPDNGAQAYGGEIPNGDYTVKADDAAGTVSIAMKEPYGFLLTGTGLIPIVCAKGTADRKLLQRASHGTGPYKLADWAADDHYTYAVRKDYAWGPNGAKASAQGMPEKVVFKVVKAEDTAVNLFLSGQLSSMTVVGAARERLKGKGFSELEYPGSSVSLFYSQRPGRPGADPAVRKALTMGLDRAQLTKVLTENNGEPPTDLEPNLPKPCEYDSVSDALPGYDPAAAKAALDAAGWTVGAGGIRVKDGKQLKLKLIYPSGTPAVDAGMELLASWWKEIGAQLSYDAMDGNAMVGALFDGRGNWDVASLGVGVSFPSQLVPFLSGPAPPDGQNFAAIGNAEYTRLAKQASATPGTPGCDLWAEAERSIVREADMVPVSIGMLNYFGNKAEYSIGQAGPEPTSVRLLAR